MDIQNLNDFGRRMTVKEVADFLGVSIATVYKKYADLGGMRVGRKYVFFEKRFIDALNLNGKSEVKGKSEVGDVESLSLPGFDVSDVLNNLPTEDRYGLLASVG